VDEIPARRAPGSVFTKRSNYMIQIFDYMNYREFLRDFFLEKKQELRFYSYRLFSQRAGLKSPNFLKLVIDGERNLSKQSVYKFAKAMALAKKETDYFENLIFFNQSTTLEEKNLFLERLMRYRKQRDLRKIEEKEYEYYSHWYNLALRELVCAADFKDDFKRLGSALIPAISAAEAAKAVKLLLQLGFVERLEGGTYVKTSPSLTTGSQIRSIAIANYHRELFRLADDGLDRFPASERDVSSLTLGISLKTIPLIKERLQQLRNELLEIAEEDEQVERVVQLNMQLFPLTRAVHPKDGNP
jgi:uncharacterized protein (TIGR02147 family)